MRPMFLASAAMLAATAGAAAPSRSAGQMPVLNPEAAAPRDCPPTSRYEAARRGGPLTLRHLDELPGADMYKAVYRHIGGCQAPIIVRFDIGGRAGR